MSEDKSKTNLTDEQLDEVNGGAHALRTLVFRCYDCGHTWHVVSGMNCPNCNSEKVYRDASIR
jgi:rubrerythrin